MTLTGNAMVLGVMGWPVRHSLSPRMHGAAIASAGMDAAYVPLEVAPERLEEAVRGLRALGFRGCNVTIPHKTGVAAVVDRLTAAASGIGAVNTILVESDGTLIGDNTDADGVFDALERAGAPSPAGRTVLVLGAGGAARAAAWGAAARGARRVHIRNRTADRAKTIKADFAPLHPDTEFKAFADAPPEAYAEVSLVLQMTSAGMKDSGELPIDPALLPSDAWVLEAVYVPLETPFLAACRARGMQGVDGLEMLVAQGARSFRLWTGIEPDLNAMRQSLGMG